MDTTFIFFLGLIIALVGVIPPGLLNMTAAKISLNEGHVRGVMFSIGVIVIVCVQTCIATVFARYLSNHPEVVEILQRVAFVIFVLITVYFLALAQKQKKNQAIAPKIQSKHSRFFQGMLLSALNVFPIPYQAYMTVTLASFGWLTFDELSITAYVAGAATGTFVMLYVYIFFFDKIRNKRFTSQKSMNYSIGIITGIVALVTLFNIIKEF